MPPIDPRHPSQIAKVIIAEVAQLNEYIHFAITDDLPWQEVFEQDDLSF